ncbi:PREDICTED: equilibrative nucleoside transporter 4 [Thamnophis sirtalis]|uniref:Equilibrative nucleoside transporter 4 n=1 Tax=Thamnophis sirtalis TaxID=35019 RepID=A0A6I9YRP4_9SAUR|nr:PREDICTED: equilibrative nucleoside transporter 4 [Thamnophis sirtalis]
MGSVRGDHHFKEGSPVVTPEGNIVMSFSFDSYQLEEEELQEKTGHTKGVLTLMEPVCENPEPQDRYHGIYFAMLLAGVGFLLPYNSFITDVDYLHHKYPGTSIVFDMSLTYILVALVAVILNNVLVEMLSLHTRITVGYLFALGPLLFVSICDVWLDLFSQRQAYAVNLMAVGVVAFGCTVQQSSFYGYTGMLPKRYTQGVMTGESTAGVIISLSRIFTKLLLSDEKENTMIFFCISIGLELSCFLLHLLVKRTFFVRYYTSRSQNRASELKEPMDNGTGYRVHHDVTAEDIRFVSCGQKMLCAPSWVLRFFETVFTKLLVNLLEILGLVLRVGSLLDIILAALPYDWRGVHLLLCSCLRVVFIPLFILCVYPNGKPTFSHPAWPCIFSLLMGITNGYFGSVPMILAAGKVSPEQRELAGNTMTVSYMTGLTLGSVVAYSAYSLASTSPSPCLYPGNYTASVLDGN